MRIDIVTLFPNMFTGPFDESIIRRAVDNGLAEIALHNLRDYGLGKHRVVDDYPHGGGAGMILMAEPLFAAVEAIRDDPEIPVILLTPQGRLFNQQVAGELAAYSRLIFVCGHYEGIDERVREHLVTDEISIGDYVLTGGELPAMVVVEAVVRQLPGVLSSDESLMEDSHYSGLLEYPQYTRPQNFRGWEVPPVLLSGNHAETAKWRREQAISRTLERRPDLLEKLELTEEQRRMVEKIQH
ncbi:MAG: tRNA (guanosine(37)-N1)-methyltransferase TrmD [Dehalococcoidia bacterium]